MSKPWRVDVREDHFAVLGANGDEMLVSVKSYESSGNARRAARNFAEAMGRPFTLQYEDADGNVVSEEYGGEPVEPVEEPVERAKGGPISPPVDGKSLHAHSPQAT